MHGKWAWLGLLLLVAVGCRTSQPELKPAEQPEFFNAPPPNARYTSYPKQAFNADDPFKRPADPNAAQAIMPTRGSMGGPGGFGGQMR